MVLGTGRQRYDFGESFIYHYLNWQHSAHRACVDFCEKNTRCIFSRTYLLASYKRFLPIPEGSHLSSTNRQMNNW